MRSTHTLIILLLTCRTGLAATADSQSALKTTQRFERRVRKAMQASQDDVIKLRKALQPLVANILDVDLLGAKSLAQHWDDLTTEQRSAYQKRLQHLIEVAYLRRIEGVSDFKVHYEKPQLRADGSVLINSRLTAAQASAQLAVIMDQRQDGSWRAYDLIIDEVSLIRNYRSQFNIIIKKYSFKGLLERMEKKIRKLEQDSAAPSPAIGTR